MKLYSKINALRTFQGKRWGMGKKRDWILSILYCFNMVSERGEKKLLSKQIKDVSV